MGKISERGARKTALNIGNVTCGDAQFKKESDAFKASIIWFGSSLGLFGI